ncbi:MAG TPA: PaaI family thioesterase [Acetobacteraceae bacterium]|nr:PaaI family thioesterase [Acetobacteraceae bacterium]
MSGRTAPAVPEGFAPHFRRSPVTDPWEPLFSRQSQGVVEIGFVLAQPHCNSRGLLHGEVIAALADNAMGLSFGAVYRQAFPEAEVTRGGAVTVSATVDYIGAASVGDWVQIVPRVLKATRSTGFVDALITADGTVIARANAMFRLIG